MIKAQQGSAPPSQGGGWTQPPTPPLAQPPAPPLAHPPLPVSMSPVSASVAASYPGLAEYMGLELSEALIRENMPEYLPGNQVSHRIQLITSDLNTWCKISQYGMGCIKYTLCIEK